MSSTTTLTRARGLALSLRSQPREKNSRHRDLTLCIATGVYKGGLFALTCLDAFMMAAWPVRKYRDQNLR